MTDTTPCEFSTPEVADLECSPITTSTPGSLPCPSTYITVSGTCQPDSRAADATPELPHTGGGADTAILGVFLTLAGIAIKLGTLMRNDRR